YEQRDAILTDTNLKDRVNDATADMLADLMTAFKETQRKDQNAALKDLAESLRTKFNYQIKPENIDLKNPDATEQKLREDLEKDVAEKETLITADYLNLFIRDQYLAAIDRKWLDHLENMEALREAVYLRSYAQKNPLTEYKVEGFQIFDTMLADIRQEIAGRLHLVHIQMADGREAGPRQNRSQTVQNATHGSMGAFGGLAGGAPGGGGSAAGGKGRSQGEGVTVVRSYPKVGRNDPCPCGSGKKYKHCHGR
ncbi:MAG: SEC-C domain-containing protein, partial [Treponema sp.]|nr:SEC-C domain-containing protein [Treponema sp.]